MVLSAGVVAVLAGCRMGLAILIVFVGVAVLVCGRFFRAAEGAGTVCIGMAFRSGAVAVCAGAGVRTVAIVFACVAVACFVAEIAVLAGNGVRAIVVVLVGAAVIFRRNDEAAVFADDGVCAVAVVSAGCLMDMRLAGGTDHCKKADNRRLAASAGDGVGQCLRGWHGKGEGVDDIAAAAVQAESSSVCTLAVHG